jgi:hypothetical protein
MAGRVVVGGTADGTFRLRGIDNTYYSTNIGFYARSRIPPESERIHFPETSAFSS